ncbi:ATP-dependent RNA helicase mak5 [Penicillium diatomitis]|uniref:ATP-dependent RNA helicase n=1 Tax=Penicillium diatomitis TaxID=2819901 RepID=A0A9W9XMT1_9EURO|nr:ATP-dependent RNA helicase mak5 [Penicillium diatomitis]KAJ5495902.1 ATP-dependent RNA helicase mak5 [Penicillium diatomitis]
MGQKRARDSKGQLPELKKRKKAAKASAVEGDASWDGVVGIDDLNWKEVSLPDRLEDATGFLGLEEIDGVDIIRASGGGEVQFKAKEGAGRKSILKKTQFKDDGEEWGGISDTESKEPVANAADADAKTKQSQKKKNKELKAKDTKGKEAKPTQATTTKNTKIKSGLSFAALEEAEDDDGVDVSAWDKLGLSPETLTSLSKLKFTSPTTVQSSCIPAILDGHDVVGKASTGSGKTLAFGIPIFEHYLETRGQFGDEQKRTETKPMALILSPTRELAHQLAKHIGDLITNAPDADARIALLTGGLSIHKQQRQLSTADIVIGTPGRVWEILSTGSGLIRKMQDIKFLVVDEADRLLSEGHFKEVEEILGALDRVEQGDFPDMDEEAKTEDEEPTARQTLVFSATFHRDLQQKLAGKSRWTGGDLMDKKESMEYLLKKLNFREEKPKFIDVNPVQQMASGLKEGIVECPAMEKDLYLYALLLYYPKHRTLVFTNSISAVRRLTQLLQNLQLPALALHSSMAQKARLRSVERFSSPTSNPSSILVATDVAARGLDIKGIDCVIHYHAPRTADTYVHRSGRTARAGAVGKSVIICAPEEVVSVARLAAKVHTQDAKKGPVKKLPLESLDIDRRVVSRVRDRIELARKITDSTIAKEKISSEDNWLRAAAEDLGVEYDSEEFDESKGKGRGRGGGRHQKEKEAGSITKAELGALRAELKHQLSQRVNIGVSERYLTAGRIDIEALLRGEGNDSFLGHLDPLDF